MWHVERIGELHPEFWWRNLWERELDRPRRKWDDSMKTDLQKAG
jgi:hypothetical protein